jgi:negative regulator of flagellin synthesis FlgM
MPDPISGMSTTSPIAPATPGGQTAATTAAGTAATAVASAAAATDQANVGQTEALLQTIIEAANDTPGIDQAKVAELRQAIASGAYQADPQSMAQKLAELETMLGTAGLVR